MGNCIKRGLVCDQDNSNAATKMDYTSQEKAPIPSASVPPNEEEPMFAVDAPAVTYWNSNPYSIDFSPDGRYLAFGSGGWYSDGGGITLVDMKSAKIVTIVRFEAPEGARNRRELLRPEETDGGLPPNERITISGVVFDESGKFLIACGWRGRHRPGPIFIFDVLRNSNISSKHSGGVVEEQNDIVGLQYQTKIEHDSSAPWSSCPHTGICFGFNPGEVILRNHKGGGPLGSSYFDIVQTQQASIIPRQHRSDSRIAVTSSGEVITGYRDSLVATNIENETIGYLNTLGSSTTTAVLVLQEPVNNNDHFLTGHRDGSIILWQKDMSIDKWEPLQKLRDPVSGKKAHADILFCHYEPSSIVALCSPGDRQFFFSADASGEILQWRIQINPQGGSRAIVFRKYLLPRLGTPRCMTIHSSTPRGSILAVGVKSPRKGTRRGYVAFFLVQLGWDIVGPWILMRRLVNEKRAVSQYHDNGDRKDATFVTKTTMNQPIGNKLITEMDSYLFRKILSYLT